MRVYLAGPLFTPYQRSFLDHLAARRRDNNIEVFVPHEHLLDGTEVDDGTACEIGMFAELLRTGTRRGAIIGLMTDIRTLRSTDDPPRMNLFVRGCIQTSGSIHTDPDHAVAAVQAVATQPADPPAAGG